MIAPHLGTASEPTARQALSASRRISGPTLAAAGLVLVLLLIAIIPAFIFTRVRAVTDQGLRVTDALLISVGRIDALVLDQETGQRGYVITADEEFLAPYLQSRSALISVFTDAETTAQMVGGDVPDHLAALRRSISAWQSGAAEPEIALVRSGRQAEASRLVATGTGRQLFEQVRADSATLTTELLTKRSEQQDERVRLLALLDRVLIGLALLGIGGVGLLLYISGVTRRAVSQVVASEAARTAVAEQQAFLRAVLQQLPVGVIIAQAPSGRVTFANDAVSRILRQPYRPPSSTDGYHGWGTFHQDGQPVTRANLPLIRIINGEQSSIDEEFTLAVADGPDAILRVNGAPVRDPQGRVVAGVIAFEDVTERRRAEDERGRLLASEQAARQEAEAALRVRDEFLSAISHDLRTPLSTIRGLTQLVLRQARREHTPENARLTERLTPVERAATKMNSMIDELLDLARLQAGRPLELTRQQVDLLQLVRECVEEYRRASPRHTIIVETDEEPVIGEWDPARLERVVTNLLSNALKYSPQGGSVTVTLVREPERADTGEWVSLAVTDTGIGIPASDLPHIFERFHRGGNVTGVIAGVGIGLAGARQIVEQHGGELSVRSVEGAGSTFTVRLPCQEPPQENDDGE